MKEHFVDRETCIGCTACVATCPKSFKMVDGKSSAILPPGDNEECIQRAIDNCPVTAISWKQ